MGLLADVDETDGVSASDDGEAVSDPDTKGVAGGSGTIVMCLRFLLTVPF